MPQLTTRRGLIVGVAAALAGAFLPGRDARAETFIVNPGESIQAAIDMAVDGDEVVVMPGTYTEAIDFLGKAITVRSDQGAGVTVLDGAGSAASLVRIGTTEVGEAVLAGLTLRNLSVSLGQYLHCIECWGGSATIRECVVADNEIDGCAPSCLSAFAVGILAFNATVRIEDCAFYNNHARGAGSSALAIVGGVAHVHGCVFSDNSSDGSGGAVLCSNGALLLRDTRFSSNRTLGSFASGGALAVSASTLEMDECHFWNNESEGSGPECYGGGAVALLNGSQFTIAKCVFDGNSALLDSGGALVVCGVGTIAASSFSGNTAARHGGALRTSSGSLAVYNSTVAANYAPAGVGGGMLIDSGTTATIWNSVLWENVDRDGGGSASQIRGAAEVEYSVVGGGWLGQGNINGDPHFFCNPSQGPDGAWGTDDDDYGDLRLRPGSPCIDAGDNATVPADALDLDGDGDTAEPLPFDLAGAPRIVNAANYPDTGLPIGAPAVVDIGAYEAPADLPPPPCPCERTGDDPGAAGAVDVFDLLAYLDLWFALDPRAELTGDDPADVDVTDLLAFLNCWFNAIGSGACP